MPSFHGIHQDCDETVKQLIVQLREQLRNPKVILTSLLILPLLLFALHTLSFILFYFDSFTSTSHSLHCTAGLWLYQTPYDIDLFDIPFFFKCSPPPNNWQSALIYCFSWRSLQMSCVMNSLHSKIDNLFNSLLFASKRHFTEETSEIWPQKFHTDEVDMSGIWSTRAHWSA